MCDIDRDGGIDPFEFAAFVDAAGLAADKKASRPEGAMGAGDSSADLEEIAFDLLLDDDRDAFGDEGFDD